MMLPHNNNDMMDDDDHDADQHQQTSLSSLVVVSNELSNHRSDDDSLLYDRIASSSPTTTAVSQPHYSMDCSTTNYGSNTPMMTHCPNFYNSNKSPTTVSPSLSSLRMTTTPPLLSLPSQQLSLVGETVVNHTTFHTSNNDNSNNNNGLLYLPSLFKTFRNNDDPNHSHETTNTTTTTTMDETTPLWNDSMNNHHVKYDDNNKSENDTLNHTNSLPQHNDMLVSNAKTEDNTNTNITNHHHPTPSNSILICTLYGMINATIVIPVILTFTTIIYSHPIFHPYLPILTQCTLFSSILHQIIFSTFSSLPFAIGQVQDAGLIFLSNMATQLAVYYTVMTNTTTTTNNINDHLIPTTMMALSLSTIVLGIALVLIGQYHLAQYVQLLPTCVVGGYLAYIGYFCGKAGILMMLSSIPHHSNINDPNIIIIPAMTVVPPKLYYVLPGIIGGVIIYMAIRTMKYMITLPVCIVIEMILFYLVLYGTNTSLHDATIHGWIRNTDNDTTDTMTDVVNDSSQSSSPSSSYMWYHTWDYLLQFHNIDWYIMLKLIPNVIGMIFVVTLSSSLDVTAIEIELQQQYQILPTKDVAITTTSPHEEQQPSSSISTSLPSLNYNSELQMIGVSNIISGCFGGYTGSYIFSQSIFSLRAGIRSRWAGYVLALCEFIVFVLPIPILSYVPNFLFASLLIMICIDLIIEWLWDVRHRLTQIEYILCLSTFVLIQSFNVEYGIIAGILLYVFIQQVLGWDVGSNTKSLNKSANCTIQENEEMDLLLYESDVETDQQRPFTTQHTLL